MHKLTFCGASHPTPIVQTMCKHAVKSCLEEKSREKPLKEEYYLLLKSVQGDFLMTQIISHFFFQWTLKATCPPKPICLLSSVTMSHDPENFELQSKEVVIVVAHASVVIAPSDSDIK